MRGRRRRGPSPSARPHHDRSRSRLDRETRQGRRGRVLVYPSGGDAAGSRSRGSRRTWLERVSSVVGEARVLSRRRAARRGDRAPGAPLFRATTFQQFVNEISSQNFDNIRKIHNRNNLFEDNLFPATQTSILGSLPGESTPKFEWRRPHEISDKPEFFIEGGTRFDIKQGQLGNCWLLAALTNLTLQPTLFDRVVPSDQPRFGCSEYCGAVRFRYWHFGKWLEVVVDDRLPTVKGKLQFLHSANPDEFWSALAEKAYAKLMGSYELLDRGLTSEAMTDITGGFCEIYELDVNTPPNLGAILFEARERNSLICCGIFNEDDADSETDLDNGLLGGHAYSITRVARVNGTDLIRLRNPWGTNSEWRGAWSDNSAEWRQVDPKRCRELELQSAPDGEFWMSLADVEEEFDIVEVCNLSPDSISENVIAMLGGKKWHEMLADGPWLTGANVRQEYRLVLEDPDDEDGLCTVLIGLMQKDWRNRVRNGVAMLPIGFDVYKLNGLATRPVQNFVNDLPQMDHFGAFAALREVTARFRFPPGRYSIVPCAFEPHRTGEFLLRVYSQRPCQLEQVTSRSDEEGQGRN